MGDFYREVLIFVAGATPQVVTETIYALSRQIPPVHADEIIIITTATGKRIIHDALVSQGKLIQLVTEYQLPPLALTDESYVVIKDADGSQLDDIRNLKANESAGDQIVELVRSAASDPDTRLHCSLAGGRKTMSFYLGTALQLFGRKQDRLYHVLVSPAFETHPDFFYKPIQPRDIEVSTPGGTVQILDTAGAEIELAELPFIRLRDKFNFGNEGFEALVKQGQTDIDTATVLPDLVLDYASRSIHIGKHEVELLPTQLMIYSAFLKQKTLHCKYHERTYCGDCTGCFLPIAELGSRPALEAMAADYARIHGSRDKRDELMEKWPHGLDVELLRQNVSKLNRSIREAIADEAVSVHYLIKTSRRKWGNSCYGVRIDKGKISQP